MVDTAGHGSVAGGQSQPSTEPRSRSRLVVVSPHLDDAALSLGATIAYATRAGVPVTVLTVFAGDPGSGEPAGVWDGLCGFATAGDAARLRREEDARACAILGAEPVWLPFADQDYCGPRNGDEIWAGVEPFVAEAALVLIPGYPLVHSDHVWLTRLIAIRASESTTLGLYVEQPYANLVVIGRGYTFRRILAAGAIALRTPRGLRLQRPALLDGVASLFDMPLEWHAAGADGCDRRKKIKAIEAYTSQVRWLGRRLLPRIRLYEWGWRGEAIGLPSPERASRRPRRRIPIWDARRLAGDTLPRARSRGDGDSANGE
jgi:LmbE family N-acetylglucosaminyl deacetylase